MADKTGDWLRLTDIGDGSTREIGPLVGKDLARIEGGVGDFQVTVPMDRSLDGWAARQARIDIYHDTTHLYRGYLYDTSHREMTGGSDRAGDTVLEGEGVGKEFTDAEIGDHISGTEKTYTNTPTWQALQDYFSLLSDWSATIYEPDPTVVETDATLQSADTTTEFQNLISPADTDPWAVQNGTLTPLQAGFLLTQDLNGLPESGSQYNGGEGYQVGSSIYTSINTDYTIPSGGTLWYRLNVVDGGHPEFDVNFGGNTVASYNADYYAGGPSWRAELIDFDVPAGTTYIEIVRGSDGGSGTAVIDAIGFTDDRYIDPPTNTLTSSGYLPEPALYPEITVALSEVTASLDIGETTLSVTANDTSGNQRLQLSFDSGSTWVPNDGSEQNTTSVTVSPSSQTRSVQGRVTLGPYGSRTTAAPTQDYLAQTVDVWEIVADLLSTSSIDELTVDGSDLENIQTLLEYGGMNMVIHHNESSKEVTIFERGDPNGQQSAEWRELDRDTGISGQHYGNSVIVEGQELSDGTRPRAKVTDDQAISEDGREIRPGSGKITNLDIVSDSGAEFLARSLLDLAQERGKRRGSIIAAPTVVEPGWAYPVDFGDGVEYVHLDEWLLDDEAELTFEPSEALGDAIADNSRGVNEAIRR